MNAVEFGPEEEVAATALIDMALREDLSTIGDVTCSALIRPEQMAVVEVVARKAGVVSGSPIGKMVFEKVDPSVKWVTHISDGQKVIEGSVVATVTGPLNALLTGERTMLNFMTHLSGIATFTNQFVEAIKGTCAQLLDTRKTLPGWRRLEKYAVRCGGGTNHRMGLFDGILIKDNHLAAWTESRDIPSAIQTARRVAQGGLSVEIEVDNLDQLAAALPAKPDIILLDNMNTTMLQSAVEMRNRVAPSVLLEASGGVSLATVAAIASTGVDRISVGGITHSAPALDLAFDWKAGLTG